MNCPICSGSDTVSVYQKKDYYLSNLESIFDLSVALCNNCRFLFLESAYRSDYDRIISQLYMQFYKNDYFPFPNRTEDNVHTMEMILANIKKENPNILEIGSNRGDLLYMIKERVSDANVLGVEPARFTDLKVPTICGFFNKEMFSCKFDVILMQHVFEHIKNPAGMISDIEDSLAEGGLLFIEVPYIITSLENGTDDFMLEHVNYFSFYSLDRLLANFTIIDCHAGVFLRTVWKKGKKKHSPLTESEKRFDLKEGVIQLLKQEKEITHRLEEYKRKEKTIVFYGISYYFRVVFKALKDKIGMDNCFFYDDNYEGNIENAFGLTRIKEFNDNCVVVICTNNRNVQEKIERKLQKYRGLIIIKPWNTINTIS